MRLFFGAHGAGFVLVGVKQTGFLRNRASVLKNGNLAACLDINRHLDKPRRVHVLDLAARAKLAEILCRLIAFVITGAANRHVHIRAHAAVLHVAITRAQVAQDLAQF